MKRHKNASKPSRVYTYGAYPSLENAQLVDSLFYRAHKFRNDLIGVELEHRKRRDEIVRERSQMIRDLEALIVTLQSQIMEREDSVRRESVVKQARCLNPDVKLLRKQRAEAELALDKARRSEERHLRHEADRITNSRILDLRQQLTKASAPGSQGILNQKLCVEQKALWQTTGIDAEMSLAVFAARDKAREVEKDCQLLWPTKNTIKADVSRAIKDGPRFRRYDGSGRVGGQPSTQGISVKAALAGPNQWLYIDGPHPDCKRRHRDRLRTVWIRVDSKGRTPIWAALPIIMHRPLPTGAHITNVYITRSRIAGKMKYEVQFTLAAETWVSKDTANSGECGIDLNWRCMNNQLRVASWGGMDGQQGHLFLPERLLRMFSKVEEIRAIRDKAFNETVKQLQEWLKVHEIPEWLRDATKRIGRWRSQRRLAQLIFKWRQNRFPGDDIFAQLDGVEAKRVVHFRRHKEDWNGWRNWDKHLYEWERNLHRKAIGQRRHLYRNFAADLARRYKHVVMEDIDWKEIGKAAELGDPDNPIVRKKKPIGAVGELKRFLVERVSESWVVDPVNTTRICPACGVVGKGGPALYHTCADCGRVWDQDVKAWLNILLSRGRLSARLTKKQRNEIRKVRRAAA